jgi:anti-sigma-K factor RskA
LPSTNNTGEETLTTMMEETSEEEVPNPPPGTPTPLREIEEEEMDEETKKKNDFEKSLWTRFIQGFAIATVVLAVLAMIFSDSRAVTVVAGVIAIGVSGCVIYQQQLLQDTDSKSSSVLIPLLPLSFSV